jgi:hypothetical protein
MSVFARGGLGLFMETDDDGVKQFVDRWNEDPGNKRILTLGLGPLEAEQGWTFVKERMIAAVATEPIPQFEQSAVLKYMQTRGQHAKVSIRELEQVCILLFDDAIQKSKSRILYEDFTELWVRYGRAIR